MFTSLKFRKGSGDFIFLVGTITVLGLVLSQMTSSFSRAIKRKAAEMNTSASNSSGVEMMLLAYRLAQITYIKSVASCQSAKPFLQALKEGSGCSSDVTVFGRADASFFDTAHPDENPFDYSTPAGGCTIRQSESTCAKGGVELLKAPMVGTVGYPVADSGYRLFLNAVRPDKSVTEYVGTYATPTESGQVTKSKFAFAIRTSLPNAAHLENDGRVTQENPDILSRCPGSIWANFLVFSPETQKCISFAQLGSGTGLAFFKNRYFGFRPADGQVIDLLAATNSPSYMVAPSDGSVNGSPAFVPYDKLALVNVDDITVISTNESEYSGQIYYVMGLGLGAQLGVLTSDRSHSSFTKQKLCDLGAMGWGQAYQGIAAASFSDPLIEYTEDHLGERLATFFLKTSGGDLLTAVVLGAKARTNASNEVQVGNYYYSCFVYKDSNLQQIEYKRTDGFDRTDNAKPYYLY